jgi:predicted nuclease of predicted toxin-antitoxin system
VYSFRDADGGVRFRRPVFKLALDEGVPDSVGAVLKQAGHKVIFLNRTLLSGSKDHLVCQFALINGAILVATDGDMKRIAGGYGVGASRYRKLNLLKISCRETRASDRVRAALALIEHEWHQSSGSDGRRIFIEILDSVIRTNR